MTSPTPPSEFPGRGATRLLVVACLLTHAVLLARMDMLHCPAMDELGHMSAGLSHWKFANFDLYRVNPPAVRLLATLPVALSSAKPAWDAARSGLNARPEFGMGREFIEENGRRAFWYFTIARWACIPWSLLGAWTCYLWARRLYGRVAGLIALSLWCFSPNVLGNGAMITPDAPAAAAGCFAGYCFWRWLAKPAWSRALAAGVALALAMLTKSTWGGLIVLWPLLWAAWRLPDWRLLAGWSPAGWSPAGRPASRPPILQLLGVLIAAINLVNLGYLMEGSFRPLGEYQFISKSLGGSQATAQAPGNRFAGTWLGRIPVPLPENYVRGIDVQKLQFEAKKWSYLRGRQRRGGWWYYYLYAMAVKIPGGTWALGALAVVCCVIWPAEFWRGRDEWVVIVPAVAVLVLVSSQTGFNRYLRYVLPLFPFLFVAFSRVGRAVERRRWLVAGAAGLALIGSVASSLAVYPHSLSYFNQLAGGPRGGHDHLVDANIDWGQDLLKLKWWIDRHPESHGIRVAIFGAVPIECVGIHAESPPPGPAAPSSKKIPPQELGPQPGWYAVSVNRLRGYRHYGDDEPQYTYFQKFEPVALAGYSIYIYRLTPAEVNSVRRDLGLPSLPLGDASTDTLPRVTP